MDRFSQSRKTVMIVDDNIMMNAFLESFIGSTYDVIAKHDGRDAWSTLEQGAQVDLVLTDIHMPDMDGVALLQRIRQEQALAQIPIVMLSSEENSSVRVSCLEAGADDFVMKPFNPDELLLRLSKILSRQAIA